ncbi:MAG: SOS response-associated peptidase [Methylovirgula sp.]
MCGRYALTLPPQAVRAFFAYVEQPNFPPRYNIAPTQPVAVIFAETAPDGARARHFRLMRWGFLPGFVKDPKTYPLVFNIRSETLTRKPSFRAAMKRRRCIFPADAFYEWRRLGARRGDSQPYLLKRRDGAPLALAGLWETWTGPQGEEVDTAAIITTAANGATSALHERLPAILERRDFDLWLDADERRVDAAFLLLRPPENDVLEFFPIGPAVNKADHDGPEVQQPAEAAAPAKTKKDETPAQGSLF